jgi:hypothetical protein
LADFDTNPVFSTVETWIGLAGTVEENGILTRRSRDVAPFAGNAGAIC